MPAFMLAFMATPLLLTMLFRMHLHPNSYPRVRPRLRPLRPPSPMSTLARVCLHRCVPSPSTGTVTLLFLLALLPIFFLFLFLFLFSSFFLFSSARPWPFPLLPLFPRGGLAHGIALYSCLSPLSLPPFLLATRPHGPDIQRPSWPIRCNTKLHFPLACQSPVLL